MSETDKPGIKNIVEFALLAAGEPLDIGELRRLTGGRGGRWCARALSALEGDWSGRSMRLARGGGGWQLVSREGYAEYLRRLRPKKPPRLSRQLLEVLAVIAYQQPATRGDIEQARGVSVSALHLATLEEFGWIEEVGRRETPGRPALFGTTKTFLSDLAIASLDELPKSIWKTSPPKWTTTPPSPSPKAAAIRKPTTPATPPLPMTPPMTATPRTKNNASVSPPINMPPRAHQRRKSLPRFAFYFAAIKLAAAIDIFHSAIHS